MRTHHAYVCGFSSIAITTIIRQPFNADPLFIAMAKTKTLTRKTKKRITKPEQHREWLLEFLVQYGGLDPKNSETFRKIYKKTQEKYEEAFSDVANLDAHRDNVLDRMRNPVLSLEKFSDEASLEKAVVPNDCKRIPSLSDDQKKYVNFVDHEQGAHALVWRRKVKESEEGKELKEKLLHHLKPFVPVDTDEYIRSAFGFERCDVKGDGECFFLCLYNAIAPNMEEIAAHEYTDYTGVSIFPDKNNLPSTGEAFAAACRVFLAAVVRKGENFAKVLTSDIDPVDELGASADFVMMLLVKTCTEEKEWDLLADLMLMSGGCRAPLFAS